jgi:hypothetical protein
LPVVDVIDKTVQRSGALRQTLTDTRPFTRRDNAGDHVEGPRPIDVLSLCVDGEGDPHFLDSQLSCRSPGSQLISRQALEEIDRTPRRHARAAGVGNQFIKKTPRAVTAPWLAHQGTSQIGEDKSLPYRFVLSA